MRHVLPFAALLIAATTLPAQTAPAGDSAVTIGTRHTMRSRILNEDRPYWVYVPTAAGATRMPVIVLMDGDGHFHHTTGITTFLANQGRMPNAIVVAIPNTTDRTHDLTPPTRDTTFRTAGGADRTLAFITDELLPEIDRRYLTTKYRVLIGHSFGGLFALHTWLTHPDAFQAYISISPTFWWDRERYTDTLAARLARGALPRPSFYATMGGLEDPAQMVGTFQRAERVVRERAPATAPVRFAMLPNEDHGTTPHRSTYDGLEMIFRRYYVSPDSFVALGVDGLDRRYEEIKSLYGFPDRTPEVVLNTLGYQLLQDSTRRSQSLDAFRANVRRHPRSANTYDSLGDGYLALGVRELALVCFEASVTTARSFPTEGSVVSAADIMPVSLAKMRQVAQAIGGSAPDPAAIPDGVTAQCLRGETAAR